MIVKILLLIPFIIFAIVYNYLRAKAERLDAFTLKISELEDKLKQLREENKELRYKETLDKLQTNFIGRHFIQENLKMMYGTLDKHVTKNIVQNIEEILQDNVLNSNQRNRKAIKALYDYFNFLEVLVKNHDKYQVSLIQEIEYAELFIQNMNNIHDNKIHFSRNVQKKSLNDLMIPPLIIQPILENSIKHFQIKNNKEELILRVKIYEQENNVYINVEDNGPGFSQEVIDLISKKSLPKDEAFGLKSVIHRLESYSILYPESFKLTIGNIINSKNIRKGANVTIQISHTEKNNIMEEDKHKILDAEAQKVDWEEIRKSLNRD